MLDGGDLDVLTGDYLAELTMLILGRDRLKDPGLGYAKTFLRQVEGCLGTALDLGVKLVTNAGGVNPAGLADAVRALAGFQLEMDDAQKAGKLAHGPQEAASAAGDRRSAHGPLPHHRRTRSCERRPR